MTMVPNQKPPAPETGQVDPNKVPMSLEGFDPTKFAHQKVLEGLEMVSDEDITKTVVKLHEMRGRIRDDRMFLASMASTLGALLRGLVI
jgi:polysaccharide pyruvyl transferase WcaK-like protein